jgi:hypothetical protein
MLAGLPFGFGRLASRAALRSGGVPGKPMSVSIAAANAFRSRPIPFTIQTPSQVRVKRMKLASLSQASSRLKASSRSPGS